jgi:hypothetical protein
MSYDPLGYKILGRLIGANMNTTSDQAIAMLSSKYIIDKIIVTNASSSLTLAAGGFFTGANKTGTTIVAAGQLYSGLTASSKYSALTMALTTDSLTASQIFLSLTTAQGGAATADIYIFGFPII